MEGPINSEVADLRRSVLNVRCSTSTFENCCLYFDKVDKIGTTDGIHAWHLQSALTIFHNQIIVLENETANFRRSVSKLEERFSKSERERQRLSSMPELTCAQEDPKRSPKGSLSTILANEWSKADYRAALRALEPTSNEQSTGLAIGDVPGDYHHRMISPSQGALASLDRQRLAE